MFSDERNKIILDCAIPYSRIMEFQNSRRYEDGTSSHSTVKRSDKETSYCGANMNGIYGYDEANGHSLNFILRLHFSMDYFQSVPFHASTS